MTKQVLEALARLVKQVEQTVSVDDLLTNPDSGLGQAHEAALVALEQTDPDWRSRPAAEQG